MRILGIDPGVAIVGFGLIESDHGSLRMLQYGAITTPADREHPRAAASPWPPAFCRSAGIWQS